MYARIARFDIGTANVDAAIAAARANVARTRESGTPEARLADHTDRVLLLVDRTNGSAAMLVLCPSCADLDAADAILNAMSPPDEYSGRRTAVERFEIAIDETFA